MNREPAVTIDGIGTKVSTIPVELSARFLKHFSEQLYSSPQKAFEELIANGWDAGATFVDVRVSEPLSAPDAAMTVFDDGYSMDLNGLRDLWRIAFSPKEDCPERFHRPLIGKFGVGKLATYVLAERLTYLCKSADGIIRRVTMNYGEVDTIRESLPRNSLLNHLELEVFELSEVELDQALTDISVGKEILRLIACPDSPGRTNGAEQLEPPTERDEFGVAPEKLSRPPGNTWTLAVLTGLKPAGRQLKIGVLRRMLAAALPLGTEMEIKLNGDRLDSAKIKVPLIKKWIIGPQLGIEELEIDDSDGDESESLPNENSEFSEDSNATRLPLEFGTHPVPHLELPGIGRLTGTVKLYDEKISAGKSELRGTSNGIHVNVLGRIVNQLDPGFGLDNLHHAAWPRFRMTVRADGLNRFVTTNRERFRETREIKRFRAFLGKLFDRAKDAYDTESPLALPDGGDTLVRSLGLISLNPLRSVIAETLSTQSVIPELIDETGIADREEQSRLWQEKTADDIKSALDCVKFETLSDDSYAKFRIRDSSVIINQAHPFVVEHSQSNAAKDVIKTTAMIGLLTDMFQLDFGVAPEIVKNALDYRDKLMRFRAVERRRSGSTIARLLKVTEIDSQHSDRLETVVSDALSYLGFKVQDLGKKGEPDGIAKAILPPIRDPRDETGPGRIANPILPPSRKKRPKYLPNPQSFDFVFDAKSSQHGVVKTGNLSLDAIAEHRNKNRANYALLIAPGYQAGAVSTRCRDLKITPMTTGGLGKLLEYSVKYGAIPVLTFREVFELFDHREVANWVTELGERIKTNRTLTFDQFIAAIKYLENQTLDHLATGMVSGYCRDHLDAPYATADDVVELILGLQIIVPNLITFTREYAIIILNTSADRLADTVKSQIENLYGAD